MNQLHSRGRIDFIYLDDRTSDLIFAEASATRVLPGVEMLAPSAEHIAAMKVHAMKNDRSRTLKEMADIQFLLQLPGVDQAQIRRYFDEAGLSERFDEIEALASDRDPGDGR
ncbi:MAG: nucleotidyl transferase AbiEii/AbiGii toxin family protein [Myxococcales bacterium]